MSNDTRDWGIMIFLADGTLRDQMECAALAPVIAEADEAKRLGRTVRWYRIAGLHGVSDFVTDPR